MKLVTVTKLDGQPAVINLDHVLVLFPNGEGARIILSNGMDIYTKAPLVEIQKQLDDAAQSNA